ncbi:GNAT family N-acetyltransferase [Scytonema hofmannii FACHB-248]|uniref:GNAT family N-acetyltransferase n=1 Tax=Scytonema hofmannii FACHB-248 TaxID=1842502 RepID=A0ABR8GQU4_9CYAN|nr:MULTISPECIES: GNAT family N-acetyltransferase [Nostocales]MBD2605822.1 GNAT family N-acetyltransferase [Scytonema hofmannii FACHB-248]
MHIDIINNFEKFKKIRENWDSVYAADPQAQFFLSWIWLSGWLQMVHEPWFIFAAKPNTQDSSYVAFFPVKIVLEQQDRGGFYTKLYMLGNSVADYTGLICLPGYEEEVIPAFAADIQQQLTWSTFDVQNILETDTRMSLFLRHFSGDKFEFNQHRIQNQGKDTDNYIAPYVSLVDNWNQYLQNYISSNTRQKIRRFLKKIESSDEFHITHVDANNLKSHIEILLRLWESKWRHKKGDSCDVIMDYVRAILRHCFENNCLYLPVLWKGDTPLGAIANFVDVHQKSMLFFIAGRDETFKNPPPGLILHAEAIRYAIQNGFKVYDFLKGNEEYKYSFGAKERRIQHIVVKYKDCQNRQLDVRIIPLALHLSVQDHRANQLTKAEQGYRQILETQSNHPEALYGLGVLMRQKGEYQTAENLLKTLLQIQPNSIKALFSLGNLYQTQGQLSEAIETYNQILALEPDTIAVYNNLGYALHQRGDIEDAIACYQKALSLKPDCVEAEVNLANALYAQGKLSPDKQAHYAAINNDLGFKCRQAGDLKMAIAYYQQSISMKPDLAEAHYNLDLVLQEQTASNRDQKTLIPA